MDSLHLLRGLRVAPLDLVQRRVVLSSHPSHRVNRTGKAMVGAGGIGACSDEDVVWFRDCQDMTLNEVEATVERRYQSTGIPMHYLFLGTYWYIQVPKAGRVPYTRYLQPVS